MNSKKRKVIISLFMSSCAGRRHLAGVFRYISRGSDWDVQLCRFGELTAKMVSAADGIITSPHIEKDVLRLIGKRSIPLVIIDFPEQKVHDNGLLSSIFSDDRSVGAAMAQHVLSYGNFRSYHFVYDGRSHWAIKRLQGVSDTLKERNRTLSTFVRPKDDEPVSNPPDLTAWLKGIAKPAVVMAATDELAIEVLNAARAVRIRVPRDLAVMGTDDDELLCEYARPSLTSVRPGHEACGYAAAEELARLFRGKPPQTRLIPVETITNRKSLAVCIPATHLIDAANDYIDRHACEGANVDDVAKALGISRRLLSLRFAEYEKKSIHDALVDRRLAEVTRLLKNKGLTITEITARCAFPNANYLKRLFKQRTGLTMREFRQASAPAARTQAGRGTQSR